MPRLPGRTWLLAAAWLAASWSFVWMIGWGTPRSSWSRLIAWYEPIATSELEATELDTRGSDARAWQATGAGSVFGLANALRADPDRRWPSRFSRAEHIETAQKYLLGSKGYDESATISAVKRMATEGKFFDPKDYRYGGAHLYLVAGSLAAGTVLGLVPRRIDYEELRGDPSPIRRLYSFARLPSAVAMSLALALLAWAIASKFGHWPALYSILLVACSPMVLNFSRNLKPPAVNAAYAIGVLVALWLADRSGRRRWLALGSGFAGLAVGSYFSSGPIILLPVLCAMFRDQEAWLERIGAVLKWVIVPATLAFLISNPFVITNPLGYAETFIDVTVAKSGYYTFNLGLQNLSDLFSAVFQGLGVAITVLSTFGFVIALRSRKQFDRMVAATVLVGLAVFASFFGGAHKDPMLGGALRYTLYLIGPLAYLSSLAISSLSTFNRGRLWLPTGCFLLLVPNLITTAESFDGLRREVHDQAESQVVEYLDRHDLEGRRGALALAVARPHRLVAFPALGIDWQRFGNRGEWTDEELPDLLLLSHPLEWFDWERQAEYRAEAEFGVTRSRFHEWLSFPCKWYARSYLYVRTP